MGIFDAFTRAMQQAVSATTGGGTVSDPAVPPPPDGGTGTGETPAERQKRVQAGQNVGFGTPYFVVNDGFQWFEQDPSGGDPWEAGRDGGAGYYYQSAGDPWESGAGAGWQAAGFDPFEQTWGQGGAPTRDATIADFIEDDMWNFGEGGQAWDLLKNRGGYFRDRSMTAGHAPGQTHSQVIDAQDPWYLSRNMIDAAGGYRGMAQLLQENPEAVFAGMDPALIQQIIPVMQARMLEDYEQAQEKDFFDYAESFMNPVTLGLIFAGLPGTAGLTGTAASTSLLGLAGSGLSGLAGGMFSPAMGSKIAAGMGSMLGGASPEQAIKGGLMGGALGMFSDFAAPYVNDLVGGLGDFFSGDTNLGAVAEEGGERLRDGASTGATSAFAPEPSTVPTWLEKVQAPQVSGMASVLNEGGAGSTLVTDAASAADAGVQWNAPTMTGALDAFNAVPEMQVQSDFGSMEAPEFNEPIVTGEDVEKYIKMGMQVNELLGGAPDAPAVPAEDAPPEEWNQYVEYLGLDAASMAEMGLEPGTPEYMEHIMSQADAIIEQVLEGMDVNAADFAQQLRSKTEEELLQLQRALHVRGTLGQRMGSGTYVDPVSGGAEEVIGEGMFNPGVAGFQRGRARDVNQLAGMRGADALAFLNQLTNRDADMFGMQGRADARMEEAMLAEEERKRRGMFSGL